MENFTDIRDTIIKQNAGFEVRNLDGLNKNYLQYKNKKLNIKVQRNFQNLCNTLSKTTKTQLDTLLK